MKDFELSIKAVEIYNAPEILTLSGNSQPLLKKLPKRWQKNAKVIACFGVIGTLTLSGGIHPFSQNSTTNLINAQASYSGYDESDLVIRLHSGGAGSSFYVVHLTEQEALGIIRARLEAAGLDFSATPPNYTIGDESPFGWWDNIGLDLFDEQKGVAIAKLSWEESNRPFSSRGRGFAALVEEEFAAQTDDFITAAFYNPDKFLGSAWRFDDDEIVRVEPPTIAELEEETRPLLEGELITQADLFIGFLRSVGVLEQQEINITMDGVRIDFGSSPVIVNDHVLVSAPELFEALGMEIVRDAHFRSINATRGTLQISINFTWGGHSIRVNDEWINMDVPAFMFNEHTLVPLRVIAEATGASIEWDGNTRTVNIRTN